MSVESGCVAAVEMSWCQTAADGKRGAGAAPDVNATSSRTGKAYGAWRMAGPAWAGVSDYQTRSSGTWYFGSAYSSFSGGAFGSTRKASEPGMIASAACASARLTRW